jgi:hypothetical protein
LVIPFFHTSGALNYVLLTSLAVQRLGTPRKLSNISSSSFGKGASFPSLQPDQKFLGIKGLTSWQSRPRAENTAGLVYHSPRGLQGTRNRQ